MLKAILKASELSRDKVEDASKVLSEGDEVEAKIISVDRKNHHQLVRQVQGH